MRDREERKFDRQEIKELRRELRKEIARRRRHRLLLLAALGGGVAVARSLAPRPAPGGGTVTLRDAEPGPLANLLGEMVATLLKDSGKKALADRIRVSIAIEDLGNPEMAATMYFAGSDVVIGNGVDADADIYVGTELALLLSLVRIPLGPQLFDWLNSEEGQKVVDALKKGSLRLRGVQNHPLQIIMFLRFIAPLR